MTLEGRITIDLFPGAGRGAVKIASSRPLTITHRFTGHRPEEIVSTISLLFATCKAAQSIASAEAFEDALGVHSPGSAKKVRALLVLAETAREHALRILIDWPQYLRVREEPPAAELRSLMQIDRSLSEALDEKGDAIRLGSACQCRRGRVKEAISELRALLEQAIFGEAVDRWRARSTFEDLTRRAEAGQTAAQRMVRQVMDEDLIAAGAAEIRPLPSLERGLLAERLFSDDANAFIAQPEWNGEPRETSPLSRSQDHPLVEALKTSAGSGLGARLVACLVELSQVAAQMVDIADTLDADEPRPSHRGSASAVGVAQIEAARGRLVHAVEMDGEKVARYRILAPTEWNFHPRGAAARGLEQIAATGRPDCDMLARLLVTAVDPCVGTDVRVH